MGLFKQHFHWSVLLDWVVLAVTVPTLFAIAGLLLFFDQFEGANVCFVITFLFIFAKIAHVAIVSTDPMLQRLLFTFLLFGILGVGIVETVRGVNKWAAKRGMSAHLVSSENKAPEEKPKSDLPPLTAKPPEPTLNPKSDKVKSEVKTEAPNGESFVISEPRFIINMKRKFEASLPFWVQYTSAYGQTISPVAVALFIDITSQIPHSEKIKGYSVAIKTVQCGWTYLVPIRMRSVRVFWVPEGGIQHAMPLDFSSNGLDYIFENPISPFGTVSGWLIFDSRVKCEVVIGEPIQYRISFETFSGKKFDKITDARVLSNNSMIPGSSEANMTGPTFVKPPGDLVDLSKCYIRFYSDEIEEKAP
jgi:hypothetical protein